MILLVYGVLLELLKKYLTDKLNFPFNFCGQFGTNVRLSFLIVT
jgi:hypothetical protein